MFRLKQKPAGKRFQASRLISLQTITPQQACCHLAAFLMLETIYIFNHIKETVCLTGEVFALSRGALSASHAAFLILLYLFFTNVSNSYQ